MATSTEQTSDKARGSKFQSNVPSQHCLSLADNTDAAACAFGSELLGVDIVDST